MITTSLFIPTDSISLAYYFESGLILPYAYIRSRKGDRGQFGAQSIIISKERWVENTNCSIEIILSEEEKYNLKPIGESFYEYPLPIPITRIAKILFLEKEKMETAVWNINNGTAFIPKRLISVDESVVTPIKLDLEVKETTTPLANTLSLVNRFNVLLGGFAFMKFTAPFGLNFSHNYFATFSLFNKTIEEDVRAVEQRYDLRFNRKYSGLFTSKSQEIWASWTKYIYGEVSPNDVLYLAGATNISINKKLGNIQLDSISPGTILFDIALLATYGNNKSKSVEDLLLFLYNSKLSDEKIEEISLLFGLHLGYSSLRNSYKYGTEERKMKFDLESRLDYFIIESLYHYVFKQGKEQSNSDFLESIIPIHNIQVQGDFYLILDNPIFYKKKEDGGQQFLEDLQNEFWNEVALLNKKISIPGFSYDFNSCREFYIKNAGSALKKMIDLIVDRYKNTPPPPDKQDMFLSMRPAEPEPAKNISILEEAPSQIELSDEYDRMSLGELKAVAKSKGIKNLSIYKATNKDLSTLINLIRGVQDIPLRN